MTDKQIIFLHFNVCNILCMALKFALNCSFTLPLQDKGNFTVFMKSFKSMMATTGANIFFLNLHVCIFSYTLRFQNSLEIIVSHSVYKIKVIFMFFPKKSRMAVKMGGNNFLLNLFSCIFYPMGPKFTPNCSI